VIIILSEAKNARWAFLVKGSVCSAGFEPHKKLKPAFEAGLMLTHLGSNRTERKENARWAFLTKGSDCSVSFEPYKKLKPAFEAGLMLTHLGSNRTERKENARWAFLAYSKIKTSKLKDFLSFYDSKIFHDL
jgi:hypothetical protein